MTTTGIVLPEAGIPKKSLSYTKKSTFLKCPRLYYYQYELGLEPRDLPKPLRMGSAFSLALEHNNPLKVVEYYKDHYFSHEGYSSDSMLYEEAVVYALASQYINKYKHEEELVKRELEFKPIEFSAGYIFRGYIDGWLDKREILIENKLKSFFTDTDVEHLQIDDQITGYVAAMSKQLDIDPESILVDYRVTIKPALRKKKGESVYDFKTRTIADIRSRPDHYQRSFPTTRTKDQVDEWLRESNQSAMMIDEATSKKFWPKNTSSCKIFNLCEFFPLCSAKTEAEVEGVLGEYKKKEDSR